MGELGNLWLYQEDRDDLKMKLQSTRLELEAVKLEVNIANEQSRETEKQLQGLLQIVYKERDEAREQLHSLLIKINPSPNLSTPQAHLMIDSNQFNQKQHPRANSSITESNTLSDPYNNNLNNNHSYVSSPVDSIFDAVTSPEFSTFNNNVGGDSGNISDAFVQDMCQSQSQTHSIMSVSPCLTSNRVEHELDHATVMIAGLVKGKVLPQKGKLLEAVMEAGPLLQTLMLAGSLPRWRNPPPLQPFMIPQMASIATGSEYHHPIVAAPMRPSWTPIAEMSCGSSSHMEANNISMLNFSNRGVNNGRLLMNMNSQISVGKRQRLM